MNFYTSLLSEAKKYGEYFEKLDLPLTGKALKNFSKGMKRKFDIIRALSSGPEALILDEPFEGLDPRTCGDIISILKQEKENGTAILMSSHDLSYVERISDRVELLRNGKLGSIEGWKQRTVVLIVSGEPGRIDESLGSLEHSIYIQGDEIQVTIKQSDFSSAINKLVISGINVIGQARTSLEDAYIGSFSNGK